MKEKIAVCVCVLVILQYCEGGGQSETALVTYYGQFQKNEQEYFCYISVHVEIDSMVIFLYQVSKRNTLKKLWIRKCLNFNHEKETQSSGNF